MPNKTEYKPLNSRIMPKTKSEIERISSEFLGRAINDMRARISRVQEKTRCSVEEIADHICVIPEEVEAILEGSSDISFETFVKLLVATDNAIEIKPIGATPFGSYDAIPREASAFHPGMMPPPPMGPAFFRPEVNPHEAPRHHGTHEVPDGMRHPDKYSNLSLDELKDIIRSKLWDSEVNINTRNRDELVGFLKAKERQFNAYRAAARKPTREEPARQRPEREDRTSEDVASAIASKLKDQAAKNPRLMELLKKILEDDTI